MSNPNLTDVQARRAFIAKRRERIAKLGKKLAAIDADHAAEDNDLLVAERALIRLGKTDSLLESHDPAPVAPPVSQRTGWSSSFEPPASASLKKVLLYLLESSATPWWLATQLRDEAQKIKQRDIPMSTLSPTLWSLKEDGLIVRDGLKVALGGRVNTNEAPPEKSPEGAPPVTGGDNTPPIESQARH